MNEVWSTTRSDNNNALVGGWSALATLESQLQSAIGELRELVAPQATVQTRMGAVRGLMDRLESELLRVEVVVAAQPSLQEARARERLSLHKDALRSLQGQLRELKPVLRRNQEAQAAKEREELLSSLGSSHNDSEKRTLLREAERGTHALHEASQMMRHERERMQAALEVTQDVSQLSKDAINQHGELGSAIGIGRSLATRLERRDTTDRILISFATAVFFLIVAYIWKSRIWG